MALLHLSIITCLKNFNDESIGSRLREYFLTVSKNTATITCHIPFSNCEFRFAPIREMSKQWP